MKPLKSFYQNGLQFSCTACGKCCSNHNQHNYVYLTRQDIRTIAKQFSITQEDFLQKYTHLIDGKPVLNSNQKRCIFLNDKQHCEIYGSRPLQCRTFPFWPENLNPKTWNSVIAKDCPGVGKGNLVSRSTINKLLRWDRMDEYSR